MVKAYSSPFDEEVVLLPTLLRKGKVVKKFKSAPSGQIVLARQVRVMLQLSHSPELQKIKSSPNLGSEHHTAPYEDQVVEAEL